MVAKVKAVLIAAVVLGLLAWSINGTINFLSAGYEIYALAGMM